MDTSEVPVTREAFFRDNAGFVHLAQRSDLLAQAEALSEAFGWQVHWQVQNGAFTAQLIDGVTVRAELDRIDPRTGPDGMRVVAAFLALRVMHGNPRLLFAHSSDGFGF